MIGSVTAETKATKQNITLHRPDRPEVDIETLFHANSLSNNHRLVYEAVKRGVDICGALVGLALSFPVMLIAAICIKFSDGGPIFFRQTRVGRGGRLFDIYKFRSMVVNAEDLKVKLLDQNEHPDDRTFKIMNDPRITKIGHVLRRLSIDEFPQFWNVLRGEMSLVGPRPSLPSEVVLYQPADFERLGVKPGITCIWQVSGRSRLAFDQQLKLDIKYIRTRTIWVDVMIILKTVPVVVVGEGAA
ncbi:sugar transferase [Planctomycetota bacterium]